MSQLWSWVLAAVGLTALTLTAFKQTVGWLVGLACQVLWMAYGISTRQWGFIPAALVYASIYLVSWRRWRTADRRGHAEGLVDDDTQPL